MKKILGIVLSLFMCFLTFSAFNTTAKAATSGDFEYTLSEGKATIISYIGSGGNVVVPSTIDGYPVCAIGQETFGFYDGAVNVTISEGIERIGDGAFYSSMDLKSVSIPSSVTEIENSFAGLCMFCPSLEQITVHPSNANYISIDGVLYTKDMTHIMQYPIAHSGESYVIPYGVRYIDIRAFRACRLRNVTIPSSVREIGFGAFSESWIEAVNIPNGVTKIGEFAFTYLNHVKSINIPRSVTSIGQQAFRYCTNLPAFSIDPANAYYISMDGVIFNKSMTELLFYPEASIRTDYVIPGTVTSIAVTAFDGARNLESITIPSSVTSIGSGAFHWCFNLEQFVVATNNANYTSQDGVLFNKDKSKIILYPPSKVDKLYTIPNDVSEIESYAFTAAHNLTCVGISDNVTKISSFAFDSCSHLYEVLIPDGVEAIEPYAFQDCAQLRSIVMPSSMSKIHAQAFNRCMNLKDAYLLGNAPTLYQAVFEACHDDFTIFYTKGATGYTNPWHGYPTVALEPSEMPMQQDTLSFGQAGKFAYMVRNGKATIIDYLGNDSVVNVPSSVGGYPVDTVGTIVFSGNSNIVNVILSEGMTEIGARAFNECGSLEYVSIPDSVSQIGDFAFFDCVSLQSVKLPKNLKEIGRQAFIDCVSLSSVTIPEGVTRIGSAAFGHCSLESISIPSSINVIGHSAFVGCYKLSSAYFYGDAPRVEESENQGISGIFDYCADDFTIYYPKGASGYTNPWHGYPTQEYDPNAIPRIKYQTHVQNIGWQDWKRNGEVSGTSGQSLRLEGMYIDVEGFDNCIEYRTHVQNIGWQDWVSEGQMTGTTGQSLRLEAIDIRLTGAMADLYDVYYRVHAQNFGWMDWAKNGQSAGSAGYSYRLEAIEIVLVEKGGAAPGPTTVPFRDKYVPMPPAPPSEPDPQFDPPSGGESIKYQTHVQNIGWQGWKRDGEVAGTSGQSFRLEGMYIEIDGADDCIEYRTHVQNIGWQDWIGEGHMTGTSGRSLRLEAIDIRLIGDMAAQYDIYYRVHAQNVGWMDWAKNGQSAGTVGFSYRLEAIQIVLVDKGGGAPESTAKPFISAY